MSNHQASPASEQSADSGTHAESDNPSLAIISTSDEHVICQAILVEEFARIFAAVE